MIVKICGITNLEDARAAVEGGATALGFNFYPPSPRYIGAAEAAEIINELPAEIWKVGVFVDESPLAVERTAIEAGLDIAQLHGKEKPAQYPRGIRVWKAIRILPGQSAVPAVDAAAEAVVLDGPANGQKFDWAIVPVGVERLVLAGGLDANNVRAAIEMVGPWGVDACSSIEASPGRKDHVKMAAFLKAALAASR